jgi:hypothetical protein
MEIKKKIETHPTKIHWSEGALFELRFLQMQAENFNCLKNNFTLE